MQITGHIVQDQMADLSGAVEGIVAHHAAGQLHPRQAAGIDPDGSAGFIGINDLHIIRQHIATQLGAIGIDLAGQLGGTQPLHLDLAVAGDDLDQVPLLQALFTALIAVAAAVSGRHRYRAGGIGTVVSVVIG